MSSHQSLGAGARLALRLMGLFAVVAGIVGMHGLANHGVGGMENTHPVMAATSTTSGALVLEATTTGTTNALESLFASTGAASASLTPLAPPGIDMEMAGLCIAVLALGLGVLSLLLRGGGLRPAPWILRGPAESVRRVGRVVDPPSLIWLSIQRC